MRINLPELVISTVFAGILQAIYDKYKNSEELSLLTVQGAQRAITWVAVIALIYLIVLPAFKKIQIHLSKWFSFQKQLKVAPWMKPPPYCVNCGLKKLYNHDVRDLRIKDANLKAVSWKCFNCEKFTAAIFIQKDADKLWSMSEEIDQKGINKIFNSRY